MTKREEIAREIFNKRPNVIVSPYGLQRRFEDLWPSLQDSYLKQADRLLSIYDITEKE